MYCPTFAISNGKRNARNATDDRGWIAVQRAVVLRGVDMVRTANEEENFEISLRIL